MDPLKISVSGVRGIVGESLMPETVYEFAKAFAAYLPGPKVIATDGRPSGVDFRENVIRGLTDAASSVEDIGIAPTPTALIMVSHLKTAGGIIITASHNPSQWNGLKFISPKGMFLTQDEVDAFLAIWRDKKFSDEKTTPKRQINILSQEEVSRVHIGRILSCVNKEEIRKRKFTVVLDSCNASGSLITQKLLKELGCKVFAIHNTPDGNFPHTPEPIPANLGDLCTAVKEKKADMGFAQDPDADRLAIVSQEGRCIGEESTLAIACEHLLSFKSGTVVVNLSTTRAIDDIAATHGSKVVRTKIGEINVVERMLAEKAVMGGEGNGGVILPQVVCGRDSLTAIALTLAYMAQKKESLSKAISTLPGYSMVKEKIKCPQEEVNSFLKAIENKYSAYPANTQDGIKVDFENSWVHVRASNTEPVVRIITEAPTVEEARKLFDEVKALRAS
ncbi:MAG: phosphoglucosamine mutase [bacterium]